MVAFFVSVETLRIADARAPRRPSGEGNGHHHDCRSSVIPATTRYPRGPGGIKPFMNSSALAVAVVTALTCVTACTGGPPATPGAGASGGPEPKTIEAAKAAAQTTFDRFSGGDFGGAWEMYTLAGKAAITRDDYIKLNEACARKGLAIQLSSARMEGTDKAVVIAKQLLAAQSYTMAYERDAWKLEPAKEGLALYAKGADRAIAAQKKAGTCANA